MINGLDLHCGAQRNKNKQKKIEKSGAGLTMPGLLFLHNIECFVILGIRWGAVGSLVSGLVLTLVCNVDSFYIVGLSTKRGFFSFFEKNDLGIHSVRFPNIL